MFISYQQTSRTYLNGLKPYVFTEYADYMLGEHVFGLKATMRSGEVLGSPPWDLTLSYEHEIRVTACKHVMKGQTLEHGLRTAWADPVVKERYFSTPLGLVMQGRARKAEEQDLGGQPWKFQKGPGKGNAKGDKGGRPKGGGKGKGDKGGHFDCAPSTPGPGGRKICFAFNKGTCTKKGHKCKFAHVCGICFKEGVPMFKCDHKKA